MPDLEDKKTAKQSQTETTVIFVDWDDTLLCSSYLSGQGLRLDTEIELSNEIARELKDLEDRVSSLLKLAKLYGHVHVVTNAETGWVQLSAKRYIPGVLPILDEVTIISARSTYEPFFPESPLKWKFYAFQEKIGDLCLSGHRSKNIISFGDSHVEREAVRAVTRGLPNTKTKSVKFAEKPSLDQLKRQLELVTNCFQYIHSHEGDLDLQLTVTTTITKTAADPERPVSEKPSGLSNDVGNEGSRKSKPIIEKQTKNSSESDGSEVMDIDN